MNIIKLDERALTKIQSAPRNKYVKEFFKLKENEAMSFDDYDEMRRVYFAINSHCRNRKLHDRPRQFSKQSEKTYMIWRDFGQRNA